MRHDGWLFDWFISTLRGMDDGTALGVVLFVLLLCGLGLPVPEDVILITAGFLSSLGKFPLWVGIVAGLIGVLSGDSLLFFLGRRYGEGVFRLPWVRRMISEERLEQAKEKVRANARWICFAARFLPGLRSPIYLVAGAMGIPPRTFVTQDGLAAMLSVPLWVVLGWYFGKEIERAIEVAGRFQIWILLAVGVTIAAMLLHRWRQRRREEPSEP